MPHLLNRAQYVALTVVLSGFERSLRQAESWLQGDWEEGVLFHTSLSLSPQQRAAALSEVATALQVIAQLAKRFRLHPADEPLTNKIAAAMSVSWANLVDARSSKLRRYGPVDPRLRDSLDPELERLAQLARSISSLVGNTAPEERLHEEDEHEAASVESG